MTTITRFMLGGALACIIFMQIATVMVITEHHNTMHAEHNNQIKATGAIVGETLGKVNEGWVKYWNDVRVCRRGP